LCVRKFKIFNFIILSIATSLIFLALYLTIKAETCDNPIYFQDKPLKNVAFSFDVPGCDQILEELLTTLGEKNIRATFFITDSWLKRNEEQAKEILLKDQEIGKRTSTSFNLKHINQEELSDKFNSFRLLCLDLLEYEPYLFRPYSGEYNQLTVATAKEHNYQTIMWSIDAKDTHYDCPEDILEQTKSQIHYGAVVKFSGSSYLSSALELLIPYLQKNGYEIVPVSKLING